MDSHHQASNNNSAMESVKFELSSKSNLLSPNPVEITCANKRRRREPPAAASGSDSRQVDQSQPDQIATAAAAAATTTTTSVKRSSRFRGVSRHRWTGRYEAHLWDKGSWNPTQRKKGKQVYLGAYDEEESAARSYDLAAIKYWGTSTFTNFPITDYGTEIEIMKTVTREEYLASLRRRSNGFSRGVSRFRGVARHHHNGRWEARIGRVFGNKYLYLGTYGTQEEAAHAYDVAAIEYRGINAVTNFDLSTYIKWLKPSQQQQQPQQQQQQQQQTPVQVPPTTPTIQVPNNQATEFSFFKSNPLRSNGLFIDTPARSNDIFKGKTIITPSPNSSSPTALGLLLRSSVFKELVEKNSNLVEEKTESEQLMDINKNEFYGHVRSLPLMPCEEDLLPSLEIEPTDLPFSSNRRAQPLWNLF